MLSVNIKTLSVSGRKQLWSCSIFLFFFLIYDILFNLRASKSAVLAVAFKRCFRLKSKSDIQPKNPLYAKPEILFTEFILK